MTTLQDFVYLLLYVAIFMVAVTLLFLMLGTTKDKDITVSTDLSDKTSITMSSHDEPKGYGRNNVSGAGKAYTKNQQKNALPTITGPEVYLDIIAVVDGFSKEEIARYERDELKITIRSHPISYSDVMKMKKKNEVVLKNLDKYIQGSSFQRIYKYDKNLNIVAVNYQ